MIVALGIAAALLAGFDWRVVAFGALVALQPWLVLGGAAGWALVAAYRRWTRATVDPATEASFFTALAAELRAGASLRTALSEASARVPEVRTEDIVRRARAGVPLEQLGPLVLDTFPANGRVAAPAFALAAVTGARSAALFETLAARAAHANELRRERRTLTAQARLSAVVVGVMPLVVGVLLLLGSRGGAMLSHGAAGYLILGIGFGLEIAGLVVVLVMLQKAR